MLTLGLVVAMCVELLAGCSNTAAVISVSGTEKSADVSSAKKTAVERALGALTTNTMYTDARGNLKGVVYSSLDYETDPALAKQNTPVEGARITVLDANQEAVVQNEGVLQTQTAADGRFSLQLPKEGQYYLQVTMDGYKDRDLVSVI